MRSDHAKEERKSMLKTWSNPFIAEKRIPNGHFPNPYPFFGSSLNLSHLCLWIISQVASPSEKELRTQVSAIYILEFVKDADCFSNVFIAYCIVQLGVFTGRFGFDFGFKPNVTDLLVLRSRWYICLFIIELKAWSLVVLAMWDVKFWKSKHIKWKFKM